MKLSDFPISQCVCSAIIACSLTGAANAENIIFPHVKSGISDASGIIDVTLPPNSVDRTGKTDVTAALNSIFSNNKKYVIVYFPNGTYLVNNTLQISGICVTGGTGNCGVSAPLVQGQSRAGAVIKLASGSFTSAASPKPVLFSGDGVAQIFNRGIHNITVLVGANNAGANGIRWFSNNTGLMSEVNVICEDGGANIGVDLAGGEQGPCGMRDIYVKGFGTGCKSNALNSVTVWNLTVENARVCGVLNEGNPLYIDNYTSANAVIGVRNTGYLMLTNAQMTGGTSAQSAINNSGLLSARDVRATGYQKALTTSGRAGPSGLTFDEYSTNQVSQFPSPTHSMKLPYKPIPVVAWEQDTTKWGNVWVNKGGIGSTPKSDSASLQSLIDNPALTTVCIPSGRAYTINGDIYIRGNISRIVGTGANLIGAGRIVVTSDLVQPVVELERVWGLPIVNQSNKTVIIESYVGAITSTGSGDLFLSDICSEVTVNNSQERVWAWQFNYEGTNGVDVQNVRTFRIVGWKDEGNGASLNLTSGVVEVLGFMNYPGLPTSGQTEFIIKENGQFSLACESQISFNGNMYNNLVQETRGGVTKTLTSSNSGSGYNLPLYTGYDSAKVALAVKAIQPPHDIAIRLVRPRVRVDGGTIIISGALMQHATTPMVYAMNGAVRCAAASAGPGSYAVKGLPGGVYAVVIGNGGMPSCSRVLVP
jgi:hypothetical protein